MCSFLSLQNSLDEKRIECVGFGSPRAKSCEILVSRVNQVVVFGRHDILRVV